MNKSCRHKEVGMAALKKKHQQQFTFNVKKKNAHQLRNVSYAIYFLNEKKSKK